MQGRMMRAAVVAAAVALAVWCAPAAGAPKKRFAVDLAGDVQPEGVTLLQAAAGNLEFRLLDGGRPYRDLAGWSGTLRYAPTLTASAFATITTTDVDPVNGAITFALSETDTNTNGFFRAVVLLEDGEGKTFWMGQLDLTIQATTATGSAAALQMFAPLEAAMLTGLDASTAFGSGQVPAEYLPPEALVGGAGVTDGDKGDISVSGGGADWAVDPGAVGETEIADGAVTPAKLDRAYLSTAGGTASGPITAPAFVGDGSGLTGVVAPPFAGGDALSADPEPRGNGTWDIWQRDGTVGTDGQVVLRSTDTTGADAVALLVNPGAPAAGLVIEGGGDVVHTGAGTVNFTGGTVTSNSAGEVTVDVGGGAGAGALVVDLGNDGSDESAALAKVATAGDTYGVFSENGDVLLADLAQKWPLAHRVAGLNGANGAGTLTGSGTLQFPVGLSLLMWDGVFLAAGVGSFDHGVTIGDAGTATGEGAPLKWRVYHDIGSPGAERSVYLWPYVYDVGEPVRFYVATNGAFSTANTRLLTTDDEGSGNGVDADTVDGVHAAGLAAASHTHGGGEITDGTLTAADLAANSVGASELDETDVEAELEAVLDLPDLQGALGLSQLAQGGATSGQFVGWGGSAWGPVDPPAGGGSAVVLDLADNGSNESAGITEIATAGDTYAVFTEPAADKLKIDLSKKWPLAHRVAGLDGATAGNTSGGWFHIGTLNVSDVAGFFKGLTSSGGPLGVGIHDAAGKGESRPIRFHVQHDVGSPGADRQVDLQAYVYDVGEPVRFYLCTNGVFSTANARLLTTDDEGSGNGLDADTVDGVHAAGLATASHTHGGGDITDGTLTAADLAANSVGASELDETDVEAELEAVLDLPDLQGALALSQLAQGGATSGQLIGWGGSAWGAVDPPAGGGAFVTNGVDGVEYTGGNVDVTAGDLDVSGDVYSGGDVWIGGQSNLGLRADDASKMSFMGGGVAFFQFDQDASGNHIQINASGGDYDTKIKGLTDNDLVSINAGQDEVAIGGANPLAKLHVYGDMQINTSLGIGTNAPTTGLDVYAAATNDEAAVTIMTEEGVVVTINGDGDVSATSFDGVHDGYLADGVQAFGDLSPNAISSTRTLGGDRVWYSISGQRLRMDEITADPSDPPEGESVVWQSDGTGSGDDGDIMVKITAGGVTKTITLIDFSSF